MPASVPASTPPSGAAWLHAGTLHSVLHFCCSQRERAEDLKHELVDPPHAAVQFMMNEPLDSASATPVCPSGVPPAAVMISFAHGPVAKLEKVVKSHPIGPHRQQV